MKSTKAITVIYFVLCYSALIFVKIFSDLPITIGNSSEKASSLVNLSIPSDNFYPIGKALLLVPFLWNGPKYFIALVFYYSIGIYYYHRICNSVSNNGFRTIALLALPLNPYLIWLIYTSQDTVFEFALLMSLIYLTLRKKLILVFIVGYLLSLTRPGYWPLFIFCVFFIIYSRRINLSKNLIIIISTVTLTLAPATLFANYKLFGAADFAEESGVTLHFSYNKYLYLALPTFDMDVFLSTKGHGWSDDNKTNSDYRALAVNSIDENRKQIVLAFLEKVDAYIFDIQKVPHLPGEYYLSEDAKSIVIGDERLTWPLVVGNALFAFYRATLILLFFFTIGAVIVLRKLKIPISILKDRWILGVPWLFGLIPGLMFYTETRFKIVSEILLAPFIAHFWNITSSQRGQGHGNQHSQK